MAWRCHGDATDFESVNTRAKAARLLINDEEYLSKSLPRDLGRQCVAVGEALMVHYSFGPQQRGRGCDPAGLDSEHRSGVACDHGLSRNVGSSLLDRYKKHAERLLNSNEGEVQR